MLAISIGITLFIMAIIVLIIAALVHSIYVDEKIQLMIEEDNFEREVAALEKRADNLIKKADAIIAKVDRVEKGIMAILE